MGLPSVARILLCLVSLCERVFVGGVDVYISLSLLPSAEWSDPSQLCPGVTVDMKCAHTRTPYDPSWRVKGTGLPTFGLAKIGVKGGIPNHSISNDTEEVDVLRVSPVLSEYDGFTYLCLYSVNGRDVNSEVIQLNVTRVPTEVVSLEVEKLTASSVTVAWSHPNQCDYVQAFQVSLTNAVNKVVLLNQSYPASFLRTTFESLQPSTDYVVSVTVTLRNGQIGTPRLFKFKSAGQQLLGTSESDLNCNQSLSLCLLVVIPSFVLVLFMMLACMAAVCAASRWTKRRSYAPTVFQNDQSQPVMTMVASRTPSSSLPSSAWQPQLSHSAQQQQQQRGPSAYQNTLYESDLENAVVEEGGFQQVGGVWLEGPGAGYAYPKSSHKLGHNLMRNSETFV